MFIELKDLKTGKYVLFNPHLISRVRPGGDHASIATADNAEVMVFESYDQVADKIGVATGRLVHRTIHEQSNLPLTNSQKVLMARPRASLSGGSHGKVWVEDGDGNMLSDVMGYGTRTYRREEAWKQAAEKLELSR